MKVYRYISLLFALLITFNFGYSQDKAISPSLQLVYLKNSENQRSLKATLFYTVKRKDLPIVGSEVSFYADLSKKVLLGSVKTDEKGVANYLIGNETVLPTDNNNQWNFASEYKGNDSIDLALAELPIKDVNLEMELTLVDSVKTAILKASTFEKGKTIPVAGELVNLFVTRTFSLLPAGDGTLGDDGSISIDFPTDIPGDKEGNLTVIAKFNEHPIFGNVEKKATVKWGIPVIHQTHLTHRALWTKGAPTWMIIALSIMLAGVWGHYTYAIISLIRIKRLADDEDPLEEFKENDK